MTAFIPFMTAGDPSLSASKKLFLALEKGGADLIEIGVPFSDPMADGPIIQKASERALKRGVTLKKVLNLVKEIRKVSETPIVLMGYYNPILAYGLKKYAQEAASAGVDANIVVDLPPEESEELDRELKKAGIDLIYLLAPTSDAKRIRLVAKKARGFVYFVSMTGVTGMTGITGGKLKSQQEIRRKVKEIRRKIDLPVVVGFGITQPLQARAMGKIADGVVVGSALVSFIHKKSSSKNLFKEVERFARKFSKAMKAVL
jgi:tryptophan synthase alpha chain